jgi:heme/copper-type cytochrome/quinol oxidase subunit 2
MLRAAHRAQCRLTAPLTRGSFLASLPTLPSLPAIGSSLTVFLYWFAVACCVVAQAAIVRAALRAPAAGVEPRVPRPQRAAEVAWVLVPAIVLALVLAFTWRAMHQGPELQAVPRGGAMVERAS